MISLHRRLPRLYALFSILVLASCQTPHKESPATFEGGKERNLEDRIEAYLQPYLETGNFTGAILVGHRDAVLFARGFGMANYELCVPNSEETVFHIASVSKSFTAAAVLVLEQQGKLNTDDPLSRFLADYPNGGKIRIHHLLTHSSGIPNVNDFPEYEELSKTRQTTDNLMSVFRDKPLEFNPGERYSYSNSNYNLLAHLIERISGRSYGEFLETEIFQPLGMAKTGHDGDPAPIVPGRASGYVPVGLAELANAPYLDWSVKTGNGSLYSTVGDLFRWHRGLREDRLLSPRSKAKAFTEHMENVGYGWFIGERFGGKEIYINGRSPGFVSYLGRFLGPELCVVVLGNIYNTVATDIGRDIAAIALGRDYEKPAFHREPPNAEILAQLIGTYQFGPEFYAPNARLSFSVQQGQLFSDWGWMMPEGSLRFRDRMYWTRVEFQKAPDGEITTVLIDGFRGEKERGS